MEETKSQINVFFGRREDRYVGDGAKRGVFGKGKFYRTDTAGFYLSCFDIIFLRV